MSPAILTQLLLLLVLFSSCLAKCSTSSTRKPTSWRNKCKAAAQKYDLCRKGRGFCYLKGANLDNNKRLKCYDGLPCGCFPDVANGYFALTDPKDNVLGAKAELNCYPGYRVKRSTTITCKVNSTWSPSSSKCKAVDCGPIQSVQNGNYITISGTTYPSAGYLVCDKGFELTYSSPNDAILRCTENGAWRFRSASCKPVDCGNPPTLRHGVFNASSGTDYLSEAFLVCDTASVPANEYRTRIVCESSGEWTAPETTCVAPGCPVAVPPPLDWRPCVQVSNMTMVVTSTHMVKAATAKSNCQSVGDLARIDTPAKMTALQDYLNAQPEFNDVDLWVQGTHNGSDWHFTNGDIMPTDSAMWYDADASVPCVRLRSSRNYRFDDQSCSYYYGYLCEISE